MGANGVETTTTEEKKAASAPIDTKPAGRRSNGGASEEHEAAKPRFFLGKPEPTANTSGPGKDAKPQDAAAAAPVLGREVGSENEAILEALKLSTSFYRLEEWSAFPDLSGKTPQIVKKPVLRNIRNS